MNNQFATQFLREDRDEDSVEHLMASLQDILDKAVEAGVADVVLKTVTDRLKMDEDGAGGSMTSSGTGAAGFKSGEGMEYTTKNKEELEEDAPMLGAGKIKDNYAVSHFGYKLAPSIPNRKSKAIQYKKLFETDFEEAALTPEEGEKAQKLLDYLKDRYPRLHDALLNIIIDPYKTGEDVGKVATQASLDPNTLEPVNENYFRFRNETKQRSKPEQYHEAIKAANKKLEEVNRILEFTSRLKEELSEGDELFETKRNTSKAVEKMTTRVAEAYRKIKSLS